MSKSDYLSKETTINLKGIFAIVILLGHLKNSTPMLVGTTLGNLISVWAYLVVGGFFFFSGYGMCLQFSKKHEDYIKNFPAKRMLPLYISCIIFSLIYVIRDTINGRFDFLTLIKAILIPGSGISFGWYIEATFIIYIFFWLFFLLLPKTNRILGFSIVSVLYLAIAFLFLPQLWFQSFGGFILGFIWCEYKDKIDKATSKKSIHIVSTVLSSICFIITFYLGNLNSIEDSIISKIALFLSVFAFISTILLVLKFFSINNPVTNALGTISLEIYCLHGFVIDLYSTFVLNQTSPIIFWALTIVTTIICSIILNIIIKKLLSLLKIK